MNCICLNETHNYGQIMMACLNQECNQIKLLCDKCIQQGLHANHQKDLVKIEDVYDYFKKYATECQLLIVRLQSQMDTIQEQLNEIKDGLSQKYQVWYDRLQCLNAKQISQAIEETKSFSQKIKIIDDRFRQGILDFKGILSVILSEQAIHLITYKKISEPDKQKAKTILDEGCQIYWYQKNYQSALEKFEQSIFINPYDNLSLFCKSDCLKMLGKYDESLPWLNKALDINPKDVNALCSKGISGLIYIYRGGCLKMLGKCDEALTWLNKALDIDQNHVNSLFNKGDCLRMLGKYDEALTWLNKALDIDPKHVGSFYSKGDCLRMLGKYDEALTLLNKALDIDPKHVNSFYSKGGCFKMLGKYDEALTWLNKALDIDQNHVNSLFNKGDCLRMLGKYDEALTWLNKALDIDPKHVGSLFNKGDCLRMQRKNDESLTWLNKALEIDPNHELSSGSKGFNQNIIALILQEKKQYREAVQLFDKVLSVYPTWKSFIDGKGSVIVIHRILYKANKTIRIKREMKSYHKQQYIFLTLIHQISNIYMYKYCKQIIKLNQVPAVINKNINTDIQFKKEFELSTQLIMLNEEISQRDNHRDFYSSIIGGVLLSLGIYSVYEVYFSKSEKQLLKFKLSAYCYLKSYYSKDLNYIVQFLNDMKLNQIRNTGFMIYLLESMKHQINNKNFKALCTIYDEISQILLSNEIYLNNYAKKYSLMFGMLLDFAISNDLPLQNQLTLPSLISYLYSENILVEIQSLFILTKFKLNNEQHITKLKQKLNEDVKILPETNELFEILTQQSTPEGYDEFKEKYLNTLQTQKQKLLKLTALKQNL